MHGHVKKVSDHHSQDVSTERLRLLKLWLIREVIYFKY